MHTKHAEAIHECNMYIRKNWWKLVEQIYKQIKKQEETGPGESPAREDVEWTGKTGSVSVLHPKNKTSTQGWMNWQDQEQD